MLSSSFAYDMMRSVGFRNNWRGQNCVSAGR